MKKLRARILLRVSTVYQLKEEDIPVQRAMCNDFIARHSDWVYDGEYIEKAISGYKNKASQRNILMKIKIDAEDNKFDILVVYMSDRLGRLGYDTSIYIADLNILGIKIFSVQEGELSTTEHIDKLITYIRCWQGEAESLKTSIRVTSAQQEMVKQGRFVGGAVPYGYNLIQTNKKGLHNRLLHDIAIDKEKAEIVREIFDMATIQMYGSYKIAKILNERKIPNKNGKEWQACTIYDMLKNPFYKGIISYGRRTKQNSDEDKPIQSDYIEDYAIIPTEVWDRAQEIRTSRHQSTTTTSKTTNEPLVKVNTTGTLLLLGFIYCGYCGRRLTNGSKYNEWERQGYRKIRKKTGYYKCLSRSNGSLQCEGKTLYKQEDIEDMVLGLVDNYFNSFKNDGLQERVKELQEEREEKLKKELKSILNKKDRLVKDIKTLKYNIPAAIRGEYIISLETLAEQLKENESRLEQLEKEIENKELELNKDITKLDSYKELFYFIPNWKQLFRDSDIQTKKVILSKIISRIEVFEGELKVHFKFSSKDFKYEVNEQ